VQNVRTAHAYVRNIVHNSRTQHSTEQFWLSSLLSSRQAPELRCCLLEGRINISINIIINTNIKIDINININISDTLILATDLQQ